MRSAEQRRAPLALVVLALSLILAGCQSGGSAPAPAAGKGDNAKVVAGRQAFSQRGCGACHRAPGVPEAVGSVGPNLRGLADPGAHPRIAEAVPNTPENLKRWLLDPQAVKPGTAMPNLGLSDSEAADLVAFLETLK